MLNRLCNTIADRGLSQPCYLLQQKETANVIWYRCFSRNVQCKTGMRAFVSILLIFCLFSCDFKNKKNESQLITGKSTNAYNRINHTSNNNILHKQEFHDYGLIKFTGFKQTENRYSYLYGLVLDSVNMPVPQCAISFDEGKTFLRATPEGRFEKKIKKRAFDLEVIANNVLIGMKKIEFHSFQCKINTNIGDSIVMIIRLKSKTSSYRPPPIDSRTEGKIEE